MKDNIKVLIYVLVVMVVVAGGVSFAYFTAQLQPGYESNSTIIADSGSMTITYENKSATLTAHNISPDNTEFASKTFTVTGTNTTTKAMYYDCKLEIQNNTFSDGAITYTLTATNTGSNGVLLGNIPTGTTSKEQSITGTTAADLATVGTCSNTTYTTQRDCKKNSGTWNQTTTHGNFVNASGAVHTYVLKLFFPETNVDQSADMSKTFAAYVSITAVNS